jgi:hypothetical protein
MINAQEGGISMKIRKVILITAILAFIASPVFAAESQIIATKDGLFELKVASIRKGTFGGITLIGQLANKSGKDYKMMIFNVVFYDADDNLLDLAPFMINELENGGVHSIKEDLVNIETDGFAKLGLELDAGLPQ